jgi:hypothetical protein
MSCGQWVVEPQTSACTPAHILFPSIASRFPTPDPRKELNTMRKTLEKLRTSQYSSDETLVRHWNICGLLTDLVSPEGCSDLCSACAHVNLSRIVSGPRQARAELHSSNCDIRSRFRRLIRQDQSTCPDSSCRESIGCSTNPEMVS